MENQCRDKIPMLQMRSLHGTQLQYYFWLFFNRPIFSSDYSSSCRVTYRSSTKNLSGLLVRDRYNSLQPLQTEGCSSHYSIVHYTHKRSNTCQLWYGISNYFVQVKKYINCKKKILEDKSKQKTIQQQLSHIQLSTTTSAQSAGQRKWAVI